MMRTITAYESDGDLLCYDCNQRLRRATAAERRESREAGPTGAIDVRLSARTDNRSHRAGLTRCLRWEEEESR